MVVVMPRAQRCGARRYVHQHASERVLLLLAGKSFCLWSVLALSMSALCRAAGYWIEQLSLLRRPPNDFSRSISAFCVRVAARPTNE